MKELVCGLLKTTKVKFLGSQGLALMRNSSLQLSKVSNDLEGSKLESVAIVEGERGFAAMTTAPRMGQILGSFSGSSSPKASSRIDV